MVDVNTQIGSIFSGVGQGFSTASFYLTVAAVTVVFLLGLLGLALYYTNKKSYNIHVVIMRPMNGTKAFIKETGYFGKHYFDKSKKELRFKIYQEKKHKMQYNGEAIDQEFFINKKNGKLFFKEVTFTPNSEGWLQPTKLVFGEDTSGIHASVTNSDMTYYQSELEMLDSLFGNKSFFEKYYLIILVILFIICICILWYMAKQVAGAAQTNKEAVIIMSDTLKQVASMIQPNNSSNMAQVIRVG